MAGAVRAPLYVFEQAGVVDVGEEELRWSIFVVGPGLFHAKEALVPDVDLVVIGARCKEVLVVRTPLKHGYLVAVEDVFVQTGLWHSGVPD